MPVPVLPPYHASDALKPLPHGFFGRRGGISTGLYHSLNVSLSSDDDPRRVYDNIDLAHQAITGGGDDRSDRSTVLLLKQVHGTHVVTATSPWSLDTRPEADALVTATPGLVLGITTADCAPLLLADPDAMVIGAAHAGWRSTIDGILEETVQAMLALGANRKGIHCSIGPCIGRASYEVDRDFQEVHIAKDTETRCFFSPGRAGHYYYDLSGYLQHQCASIGIASWDFISADTCADEQSYFSYRRSLLRKESGFGTQISAIALPIGA